MGLNDSNAENKQSVNDCSEIKVIFIGLFLQYVFQIITVSKRFMCITSLYIPMEGLQYVHADLWSLNSLFNNVVNTEAQFDVLTLTGFSWLMMVVFPLLSSPKHKTLTSFFLRPSHPDSLSSSPIRPN